MYSMYCRPGFCNVEGTRFESIQKLWLRNNSADECGVSACCVGMCQFRSEDAPGNDGHESKPQKPNYANTIQPPVCPRCHKAS